MKLKMVQFVNVVSFGGQLQSATNTVVGDRPGQVAADLELDEKMRFITMTRAVNGVLQTKQVPMSNVACFELAPVPPPLPVKEVKK